MTSQNNENLRSAAMKGGAYLAGRQVISIGLKTVGVMLITRALGPASYGAYVSAFNIYQYLMLLGGAGVGIYLLRQEGIVSEKSYSTVYTIMLTLALLLAGALEFGRSLLSDWIGVDGFSDVIAIMIMALPLQLMTVPASIRLERALNYRAIALLETLGQVSFYAIAITLVMMHFGPKALGIAWVVQQGVACVLAHILSKSRPTFAFDRSILVSIFKYASSYSVANWIWQLRMLINPLIVGPALGAQAVGLIGMTIGLLEMLSIIKTIVWRLSVAVLGRVQNDAGKLLKAVNEGMELQTLTVGAILLGFGWTGHFFVPLLFGQRWAPIMDVYPYIAASYLTATPFNMHSAALSVINRNSDLAVGFAAHIILFAGTAYLAVPHFGMLGYGYGELATLPAYAAIHFYFVRAIGSPNYAITALWWGAAVIGLFWVQLGLWAIVVPFLVLALPVSIRRIISYFTIIRQKRALA